jgi:hypothetical protein
MDPFGGLSTSCDTLTNIKSDESRTTVTYTDGIGFYSGFNTDSIATYAEFFSTAVAVRLTGVALYVDNVNSNAEGGIIVSINTVDNGFPGSVLSTVYVPYHNLSLGANYIEFYPYVSLNESFFVTYTMAYSSDDFFALQQAPFRANGTNTAFMMLPDEGWKKMSDVNPDGFASSLAIDVFLCHDVIVPLPEKSNKLTLYPNPASTTLIGKLSIESESYKIEVFDTCGRRQNVNCSVYDDTLIFFIGDLSAGLYVVRVLSYGKIYTEKFIKR